jgi:DNA uptake protein ComE-like DNA-binding protein
LSEAIAAYRKANGFFRDFEAVTRVPGIDVKTLEEHKDAVAF